MGAEDDLTTRVGLFRGVCKICGKRACAKNVPLTPDGQPVDPSYVAHLMCHQCRRRYRVAVVDGETWLEKIFNDEGDYFIPGANEKIRTAAQNIRASIINQVIVYDSEQAREMLDAGEVTHISLCRVVGTLTGPGEGGRY